MSGKRSSIDGDPAYTHIGAQSKPKMHLALLKLSTANAFVKTLSAASSPKSTDAPATSLTQDAAFGIYGSGGSLFFPDDALGNGGGAAAMSAVAADSTPLLGPQPRSPYYGLYADYEDVMELLYSGMVADGSARGQLAHVTPDQLVHVAHLGLGACCSVDLIAVHCPNGGRLLAAAKSCYLPPVDPRLRASLREADLLRRCAECPFIIQLLAVLQQRGLADCGGGGAVAAAAASSPAEDPSPTGTQPRTPLQQQQQQQQSTTCWGEMVSGRNGRMCSSEDCGLSFASPWLSASSAASSSSAPAAAATAAAAMMSSRAYQSWAQWRGGGAAEDLERQIMQRLSAAVGSNGDGASGGGSGGGFCTAGGGAGGDYCGVGYMALGNGAFNMRNSLVGWEHSAASNSNTTILPDEMLGGCGAGGGDSSCCSSSAFATQSYGGGWVYGGGFAPVVPRGRRCRRASMEVIDMYGGCPGMDGDDGGAAAAAAAEPPVMCTLLIGWARGGDLRRLVQLLLGRSPAHQNNKVSGAAPAVSGLLPLIPEDAARFYTGCVVLALEHLHVRLNTVHRDLKLANLLLLDSGYVVVGDLGTAVDLGCVRGGRLNSRVGSPGHMAPECRDRDDSGYDTSADIWSLGACLFSLLTGQLPAGLAGPPHRQWTPPLSRHWSQELQGLLVRLMAWTPSHRPTVAQLLRDPWFRGFNWNALREQRMHAPSSTPWRELLWWPKENRQLL